MCGMPPRKGCVRQRHVGAGFAAGCLILLLGGCASISTPLPDTPRTAVAPVSKEDKKKAEADRKKAVEDLAKAAQTNEQQAKQQIDQSR